MRFFKLIRRVLFRLDFVICLIVSLSSVVVKKKWGSFRRNFSRKR